MTLPSYLTGDRLELERVARENAHAVALADGTLLCRVLGKYLTYVDAEDLSLTPHLCLNGYWESWITLAVGRALTPGMHCVDVGANVGYFSLLLARCVAPTGCVVAFEPNPRVMSALRQNIARNEASIARVIPVATAAGAAGGSARFAVERRSTRGKVVPEGGDFEVEVTTVDDAAERYGSPRLLKVDVEGAELDVLVGARRVLEETHPTVIVEVHSADLERRSALLLEERGYECERRTDRGKKEPYLLAR